MAIFSNGKFYGFLCSVKETGRKLANGVKEYVEDFVSGFAGHGWKLWEYVKGKWMLEIDAIRVRGQFTVFELLVSKIRAIIGAQAITQGCGKIKTVSVSEDGKAYLITIEEDAVSFVEHDFIRCQNFSGGIKSYHVEIESVTDGIIRIPVSEFETLTDEEGNMTVSNPPSVGDDIVQFGNSSHEDKYAGRHSAIYMHADENAQPAIDVLDGIYSKDWSDCLKVRVGGDIPGTNGLKGFYCVNGVIKGTDSTGHTTYCIYPDGTAEFGDGAALFKPDKSGHIAGGAIAWEWDDTRQKYVCTMKGVVLTWDNLDDEAKENLKGEPGAPGDNGASIYVQYSTNGTSWHDTFSTGDIYMRQKQGNGSWSALIRIVGENGSDGEYTDFQFAVNNSLTVAPTSGWQDAPPVVGTGQYLWMRSGIVAPPATSPDSWKTVRIGGEPGKDGLNGDDGINGADGVNGKDGISLMYKGEYSSHPDNPKNGWYYRNTTDKKCYVYQDNAWYVMTVDGSDGKNGLDGINGKDGNDGLDIVWKGDSSIPPDNPQKNWAYRDTDNGRVYIYNGTAWSLMVADGNDGVDGTDGEPGAKGDDGLSVFITYHDSVEEPDAPTGDGTSDGWHTDSTSSVIWISQKVAENADSGTWGNPIRIKGEDGKDANLLPWIEEWNGYATEIGEGYIVTPKLFSGTKTVDADGKVWLTGIAQGKDCLTAADGTKRTGIFALVNNEIVFELDPISKTYLFTGQVNIANKIILNQDGSGILANGKIGWDIYGNMSMVGYIQEEMQLFDSGILDLQAINVQHSKLVMTGGDHDVSTIVRAVKIEVGTLSINNFKIEINVPINIRFYNISSFMWTLNLEKERNGSFTVSSIGEDLDPHHYIQKVRIHGGRYLDLIFYPTSILTVNVGNKAINYYYGDWAVMNVSDYSLNVNGSYLESKDLSKV